MTPMRLALLVQCCVGLRSLRSLHSSLRIRAKGRPAALERPKLAPASVPIGSPRRRGDTNLLNLAAVYANVRLDAPLLRRSSFLDRALPPLVAAVAVALAAAVGALMVTLLFSAVESMSSKGDKAEASEAVEASEAAPAEGGESLISRLTAGARNVVRLRLGAVGALRDAFRLWWFDVFGRGAVIELPADKPALCTVADVDEFGDAPGKCCVYRFALAAGPGAALPLDLGQELEVAVLDEKNRMVRASFPLASSRFEPGFVEICAPAASRRDARVAVGGLAPSQRAVVDALDARGVGGDVAVKPGKRMFEYEGRFVPITSLQCFVEDLGALPVIQLLKESLPRGRSTVATAQVFWVNESEDDFALYNALEALYYKFSNKMEISCIVDDRVHEDDSVNGIFARNPELDEVVEPWMPGKLAVVAGPAKFATQVSAHLTTNMGYPAECVIRLTGDGTAAAPL